MLKLSELEEQNLKKALLALGYGSREALLDIEETTEGSRSYHFEVYPSGIGDVVYVVYKGNSRCISDLDSF